MNRNKSRLISLIEVDLPNPSKHYDVNNEDVISEHKSEYISFSQSQKCWKFKNLKEKIYRFEEEEKAWSWFR